MCACVPVCVSLSLSPSLPPSLCVCVCVCASFRHVMQPRLCWRKALFQTFQEKASRHLRTTKTSIGCVVWMERVHHVAVARRLLWSGTRGKPGALTLTSVLAVVFPLSPNDWRYLGSQKCTWLDSGLSLERYVPPLAFVEILLG
jgi:hypothetical protein